MNKLQLLLVIMMWMLPATGMGQGLWEKIYSNPVGGTYAPGNHLTVACWDPQFGGLVGYLTDSGSAYSVKRCFYVSLNAQGDTVWTKSTIFNKNHHWQNTENVKSICRLSNGDFIISALCDTMGLPYFHLMRIDGMGNNLFLKVDTNLNGNPIDIQVAIGPNGGYYVVKNRLYYTNFSNYRIVHSSTLIERYNSNNAIVATDSFVRTDYKNCFIPPCSYGTSSIEYSFPKTAAVLSSTDGGLFWVFQQDSSAIFSPAACGLVPTSAVPSTYVYKFDSGLHVQWRTLLTPALHLKADSLFAPAYAFHTSDSGIVIAGQVMDTPGIYNYGPGLAWAYIFVKLSKYGLVTDTLRSLPGTNFGVGTETSSGNIIIETFSFDPIHGRVTEGLCLLDKHFRLLLYTPHPFSTYPFHFLGQLYPNQQGGAFAPYFIDTSAYILWKNPIPAAINCDSLLYHYPALASGKILNDLNANCSYETAIDKPIANRLTQFSNTAPNGVSYYTFTDAGGNWTKALPYGNYNIKHAIPPNKLAECPSSNGLTGVNLNTSSSSVVYNFYDTLKTNYKDMKVLLSSSRFVPGFTRQLVVYAINNGGTLSSDTLRISKSSILNYISSNPSPTSISGNTFTWILNNIAPDSIAIITLNLKTPSTTSISTPLTFSGTITGITDSNPTDNTDTLITQVVGPADPNYKTINRPTYTTAQKDWIYTIEFQNVGNYPAQNVLIADDLDPLLDPTTIRLLKASHGTPQMEFQDGNELLFRFNNIYLQDSVHNEPASHGYVTFSIRPVTNIRVGNYIRNSAAIYFDYNAPILTNSTYNIIATPGAIPADILYQQRFSVYPNPATNSFTIHSETSAEGVLLDMQGKNLLRFPIQIGNTNIHLPETITPGIYMLQVRSSSGEAVGVLRLAIR